MTKKLFKKIIPALGLISVIALSAGCGSKAASSDTTASTKASTAAATEASATSTEAASKAAEKASENAAATKAAATEAAAKKTEAAASNKTSTVTSSFSFSDLKDLQFMFSSGAGAWSTELNINSDGSFTGYYHDSEMGERADSYPNGTVYACSFSGQFSQPEKVNSYTYAVTVKSLNYDKKVGTEEILDGIRYVYSEAYGMTDSNRFLIYLPGAPLSELPSDFLTWIGYYDLSATNDTELSFYSLNNEKQQQGFTSYSK